jgi:hypothetical protein
VLVGQGEKLAHRPRAGLAQRLEQPLDHRAKQLLRLEVERRPRQAWVAPKQERGAELVQSADCPVEQGADGLLGVCIAGQFVQVALDDGRGAILFHAASSAAERRYRAIIPPAGETPPRSRVRSGRNPWGGFSTTD